MLEVHMRAGNSSELAHNALNAFSYIIIIMVGLGGGCSTVHFRLVVRKIEKSLK